MPRTGARKRNIIKKCHRQESFRRERGAGEGRNAEWIISYYRDKFRVNFSKIEPLNFRALINSWILADKDSRRLIYIICVIILNMSHLKRRPAPMYTCIYPGRILRWILHNSVVANFYVCYHQIYRAVLWRNSNIKYVC